MNGRGAAIMAYKRRRNEVAKKLVGLTYHVAVPPNVVVENLDLPHLSQRQRLSGVADAA